MTQTATLSRRALRACVRAADDDSRYYLRGVYVEITARGAVYVATNGHSLLCASVPLEERAPDNTLTGNFIIPAAACRAQVTKRQNGTRGKIVSDAITLRQHDGFMAFHASATGEMHAFRVIDGTYPDWRRVIPRAATGEPAHFDPKITRVMQQAAEDFYGFKALPVITPNGNGNPALVRLSPTSGESDFFGVIMPARVVDCLTAPPAWAIAEPAPAANPEPANDTVPAPADDWADIARRCAA
jgi:hypothetical protein